MDTTVDSFLSTSAEVGVGIIGFTGVVVALLGPMVFIRAMQARRVAPEVPRDFPSVLFGLASVFGLVAAGFRVYNIFENKAWPYMALIGALVIVSIVSFGVLLLRVWRGEADA